MFTVGITIGGALAAGAGFVSWAGRKLLFPAPGTRPSAAKGRDDVEILTLPSGTEAWLLPPLGSHAGKSPVLIFCHGNGELIDDWLDTFDEPRTWGVSILLVEYPGYGRSPGKPSERTITRTAVEAFDALLDKPHIDPQRLIAYGRSLGGGAAAALARHRPIAAMILESTFTSVTDIARSMGAPGFLILDPFDNEAVVRSWSSPLLILHGRADRVIPFEHGQRLHRAARSARFESLDCGHNDCPRPWKAVFSFLREHRFVEG